MKFCFPARTFASDGLGNELFPIAKAHIAAQELDATFLPPSWARNRRNYTRFFGPSNLDWARLALIKRAVPVFRLTRADYEETGETDYGKAVRAFAKKHELNKRKSYALVTEGMWGYYYPVRNARPFVERFLRNTHYTTENIYHFETERNPGKLTVAVNVRMTDFRAPAEGRTKDELINTRLPASWYANVCRSLRASLGEIVEFYLVTDGTANELADFIDEFRPLTHFHRRNCDISNLLIMARHCDLIVCSVSTYSQWAAFLSDAPYIWYRDHLTLTSRGEIMEMPEWRNGGLVPSLFGRPSPNQTDSATTPRGVPSGPDGDLPEAMFSRLRATLSLKSHQSDLIMGGISPI